MSDEVFYKTLGDLRSWDHEYVLHMFRRGESMLHPKFVDHTLLLYTELPNARLSLTSNMSRLGGDEAFALRGFLSYVHFSTHPQTTWDVVKNFETFLDLDAGFAKTQVSWVDGVGCPLWADRDEFVKYWRGKVDRVRIYENYASFGAWGTQVRTGRVPCRKLQEEIAVLWDGTIARCNHSPWYPGEGLGNVMDGDLKDIWVGSTYATLRENHRKGEYDSICGRCNLWYPEDGKEQGLGLVFE